MFATSDFENADLRSNRPQRLTDGMHGADLLTVNDYPGRPKTVTQPPVRSHLDLPQIHPNCLFFVLRLVDAETTPNAGSRQRARSPFNIGTRTRFLDTALP
jgi:hypothetical protein